MPPKKKQQEELNDLSAKSVESNVTESGNMATFTMGLEALLDRCLKQQSDQINSLFVKFTDTTRVDLQSIKQSPDFLASKFDDLVASTNKLNVENNELRKMNSKLQERVGVLENPCNSADDEIESTKRYLRRDLLEFHGIPESVTENTNSLVLQVVNLVAPELNICESDISTSHRLPAAGGNTKPIIVKFVSRDTRDGIYRKKRNLNSKSTVDIGFQQNSRLYINESLTAKTRAIPNKVKEFKRRHHFKFVWTRQGKVFLKRNENQSETHVFVSLKDFEEFNEKFEG